VVTSCEGRILTDLQIRAVSKNCSSNVKMSLNSFSKAILLGSHTCGCDYTLWPSPVEYSCVRWIPGLVGRSPSLQKSLCSHPGVQIVYPGHTEGGEGFSRTAALSPTLLEDGLLWLEKRGSESTASLSVEILLHLG
jgi:hypothetical protein